ncbi:sugar-binding domain-containing protein [Saccharicrinis sp. FJH62]|uniref:sugar-binding domain-containing protein n=1 Tax=Saccharicrinis sp. FJH62 TaxID=3344657 RepID=UPI0035D4B833
MKLLVRVILVMMPVLTFAQDWQMKEAPLMTSFSKDIDPNNVLPEYPRPQMVRDQWMNLNGIWQYQPGEGMTEPVPTGDLAGKVLVPYPIESAISGVMEYHPLFWYRRLFTVPEAWEGQRVIIHFGAVDYRSQVIINGTAVGIHAGGYDPFSYDITDYLNESGDQEIIVRVYDPTDDKGYPRGKQTLHPGGIMYTSTSGIWQTVWLEPVPVSHIEDLKMIPDIDNSKLNLTVNSDGNMTGVTVKATVMDGDTEIQSVTGAADQELNIPVPNQKLWSPESPFLYNLEVKLVKDGQTVDSIGSYFGMRKISMEDVNGIKKMFLNNEFLFQMGPLDQGFWPDGLYTAPTDEALKYDLEMIKTFGFNMVRKHIKVEPYRWYYWADKLGVLVWQDMPSINSYTSNPQPLEKVAFKNELQKLVETHFNCPSIIMWVVFNEAQGQHDTKELVQMVMDMDPSRLVNQASGGWHEGVGHVLDHHSYPPPSYLESTDQIMACGEYGGLGYIVDGHLWNADDLFQYVTLPTTDALASTYEDFADQLTIYKTNNGLSAAVYTEITDVEIELNGLMTYDRLIKPNVKRIRDANRKVIYHDLYKAVVVPASEKDPQIWKFTVSQPAANWYTPDFSDAGWNAGSAGFGTEGTPGAVVRTNWDTEDIWMRREFHLADLEGVNMDNLVLNIHHDEDCEVYFNGVLATSLSGYTSKYVTAEINAEAKNALKANSDNIMAIHCKQTGGGQYIDAGISMLSLDEPILKNPNFVSTAQKKDEVSIFPVPVDDFLNFSKPYKETVMACIYDINGAEVKRMTGRLSGIDVSELNPGVYLLKVEEGSSTRNFRFVSK